MASPTPEVLPEQDAESQEVRALRRSLASVQEFHTWLRHEGPMKALRLRRNLSTADRQRVVHLLAALHQ